MLGSIHAELGNVAKANVCLKRALALNPNSPETHFGLGNVQRLNGNLAEAVSSFQKAVMFDLGYAEAWGLLRALHGVLKIVPQKRNPAVGV